MGYITVNELFIFCGSSSAPTSVLEDINTDILSELLRSIHSWWSEGIMLKKSLKATSHTAIFCASVYTIKDTDNVMTAKDGSRRPFW